MVQVNIGLGAMHLDLEQIHEVLKSTQTVLAGSSALVAEYCREIKLPKMGNRLVPGIAAARASHPARPSSSGFSVFPPVKSNAKTRE